jgi:hypothetical protein
MAAQLGRGHTRRHTACGSDGTPNLLAIAAEADIMLGASRPNEMGFGIRFVCLRL